MEGHVGTIRSHDLLCHTQRTTTMGAIGDDDNVLGIYITRELRDLLGILSGAGCCQQGNSIRRDTLLDSGISDYKYFVGCCLLRVIPGDGEMGRRLLLI